MFKVKSIDDQLREEGFFILCSPRKNLSDALRKIENEKNSEDYEFYLAQNEVVRCGEYKRIEGWIVYYRSKNSREK